MNQEDGYLIARLISSLFKSRPSYAYAGFGAIIAIILGVLLTRAKTPEERVFPIIGLTFVLVVVLVQVFQAIKGKSVQESKITSSQDNQVAEEVPSIQITSLPPIEQSIPHPSPLTLSPHRRLQPVYPSIIGAALAGGIVFTYTFCIASAMIPVNNADAGEGIAYLLGFVIPIIAPVAASLGALGSLAMVWLVRRRRPEATVLGGAILTGAGIGLISGIVAVRLLEKIICMIPMICSP